MRPHVSRVLADLVVEDTGARITWRGVNEAMLSSLFDAPGGARRVTLVRGMTTALDDGKNELVVFTGRRSSGQTTDLTLTFVVSGGARSGELTELPPRAPRTRPRSPRRHRRRWTATPRSGTSRWRWPSHCCPAPTTSSASRRTRRSTGG
ncbi:hypothetical protein NQP46_14900 [Streptomyces albus]|nr:hypothetical protein NQP46_14900 [Streptomyces albus]